jgi:hypothetical protein
MTQRRREGIDTDTGDEEVTLEVYDEDEHGQIDADEREERRRERRDER